MYFYYTDSNGTTRQIEADSYQRINSGNSSVVRYDHNMGSGPYSQFFSGQIISVQSLGGTWKPNPSQAPLPCFSSLPFESNRIFYEFDDPYTDNSGVCSYDVLIASACQTVFYSAGAVVLTLDFCPTIDDDPRNPGCEECCRSLLASVRSLHI